MNMMIGLKLTLLHQSRPSATCYASTQLWPLNLRIVKLCLITRPTLVVARFLIRVGSSMTAVASGSQSASHFAWSSEGRNKGRSKSCRRTLSWRVAWIAVDCSFACSVCPMRPSCCLPRTQTLSACWRRRLCCLAWLRQACCQTNWRTRFPSKMFGTSFPSPGRSNWWLESWNSYLQVF